MEAVSFPLPKFNSDRSHPIPTPVTGSGHFSIGKLLFKFVIPVSEGISVVYLLALR